MAFWTLLALTFDSSGSSGPEGHTEHPHLPAFLLVGTHGRLTREHQRPRHIPIGTPLEVAPKPTLAGPQQMKDQEGIYPGGVR